MTAGETDTAAGSGPLEDVTVLAAEHLIAAPFATQLLADLGARVIRVERPGKGPIERSISPFVEDSDGNRESLIMYRVDRNKRSVTLDLSRDEGREIFKRMAKSADVVIQNFRAGVMERQGLGYDALAEVNPALVYVSITGYGQPDFLPSPYSEYAAYGNIAESLAGITFSLMHGSDYAFSGFHGMALGDIVSGMFALGGLLAALHEARRTGRGRHVDVAMMDSLFTLNERSISTESRPGGEGTALDPPSGILGNFRASDGWFTLTVIGEQHWPVLCEVLARPDLRDDPALADADMRSENLEALVRPAVEKWAEALGKEEAARMLRDAGIAAAPVLTASDLLVDPHIAARKMIVGFDGGGDGPVVRVPGNPIKMSGFEPSYLPPPALGEHTDEVLADMAGLDTGEIERLRSLGVI